MYSPPLCPRARLRSHTLSQATKPSAQTASLPRDMTSLKGLVCLVAGGASGLGLASVKRLVSKGAKVLIADLPSSGGEDIAREIGYDSCIFAAADVSHEIQFTRTVGGRRGLFGGVDTD